MLVFGIIHLFITIVNEKLEINANNQFFYKCMFYVT